jgi:hypothetical protein
VRRANRANKFLFLFPTGGCWRDKRISGCSLSHQKGIHQRANFIQRRTGLRRCQVLTFISATLRAATRGLNAAACLRASWAPKSSGQMEEKYFLSSQHSASFPRRLICIQFFAPAPTARGVRAARYITEGICPQGPEQ